MYRVGGGLVAAAELGAWAATQGKIFAAPRSDETVLETSHTVLFSVPWQVYPNCQTRIDELDRANSALECVWVRVFLCGARPPSLGGGRARLSADAGGPGRGA